MEVSKISKDRHNIYIIVVIVLIAQYLFEFDFIVGQGFVTPDFDLIIILLSILCLAIVIFAGNHYLKELTIWRKVSIVIYFVSNILVISGSLILLYIPFDWLQLMTKFVLLCLSIIGAFMLLSPINLKLSNKKFKLNENK